MTSENGSSAYGMAPELIAERREQPVREGVVTPRAEAREQRRRDRGQRHGFLDGVLDRPAPFAGVLDVALQTLEPGVVRQCRRGELEQPRADDGALIPELGDLRQVESVLRGRHQPSACIVGSVASPAGTITRTARGGLSALGSWASEPASSAPLSRARAAASAARSQATIRWPPRASRVTMLPPIRPRPTNPSSIRMSSLPVAMRRPRGRESRAAVRRSVAPSPPAPRRPGLRAPP